MPKPKRCFRHPSRPAYATWHICSDGTERPVCRQCDIELNKIGLKWAFPRSWRRKLTSYIQQLESQS